MVVVNFRLNSIGRIEVEFAASEPLETVLQRCSAHAGERLGGFIAVRRGRVIRASDMILDGDEIDILPAIFGG